MKEFPAIFSAPMVRAILEGRKTQTRRLPASMWANAHMRLADGESVRLWVRETWAMPHGFDLADAQMRLAELGKRPMYRATDNPNSYYWRPSIHMPRWASRITLDVVSMRLERVQDISEEDAVAEGIGVVGSGGPGVPVYAAEPGPVAGGTPRDGFALLWGDLHCRCRSCWNDCRAAGKCNGWAINPEVYRIEFRRA